MKKNMHIKSNISIFEFLISVKTPFILGVLKCVRNTTIAAL